MTGALLPTILLTLSIASALVLGGFVLWRNPQKPTHQLFFILTVNLSLWATGVLCIVNSTDKPTAEYFAWLTFMVSTFLPATFYQFIGVFPSQRFEASKALLAGLYVAGLALCVGTFFDALYSVKATLEDPGTVPPNVEQFGAAFHGLYPLVAVGFFSPLYNILKKLRGATGIERRQIQHVLLGVFASMALAIVTNIIAPLLDMGSMQPYGPSFTLFMVAIFAYAMVRYHLLDIRVIIGSTTVYAFITGFVMITFIASVWGVQWLLFPQFRQQFETQPVSPYLFTTFLAALIIALVLQPLRERIQLFVDRRVLKRRYDLNQLLARISREAARMVQLDSLLEKVGVDIQETVGARPVRFLLLDRDTPGMLVTEYSSKPGEKGTPQDGFRRLIEHAEKHPEALALEQLIHTSPSGQHARLATSLAELDAFLCVPLATTAGLIGFLTLGQKASFDIYTKDEVIVFTALAVPLATAIENARLYRELQEANLHRSRILSHMRGGVIAVDPQGRVTLYNSSASDLLGNIETGEDVHQFHPAIAEVLDRTLEQKKGIRDFETILDKPGGEKPHVAISTACLTSSEHGITGAMAMIYDLTHVKRLEQNVQRADRLTSIGTLAAGMAHEIKNPLVSIKTFAQLLSKRYDDAEFRTTFVDIVPHEVDRIDSIVSRLLDFARPATTRYAPNEIRHTLDKVLALVDSQLRPARVELEVDFPEEHLIVQGDQQQLHQVFLNLILNALDAMHDAPVRKLTISVTKGRMRTARGGLPPLYEVDCARIAVSDTGSGIDAEHMDNLFNPFFTTKPHGSGLGLAVVHGIVAEHGGEIEVDSAPRQGATFIVRLPTVRKSALVEDS